MVWYSHVASICERRAGMACGRRSHGRRPQQDGMAARRAMRARVSLRGPQACVPRIIGNRIRFYGTRRPRPALGMDVPTELHALVV